ncbi:MAG TPA: TonB family protein, partial [Thermodesulfobacteriota bacterium]|nr:TonB family protein [Thermodesulfobacteriota bacterium]
EAARAQAERLARLQAERERIRAAAAQAAAAVPSGPSAEELQVKFSEYYNLAAQQIRGYWLVPEWVRAHDVNVVVSVKVARDGRIVSITIERRSGNPGLDQSVERALEKARLARLPPLPEEFPGQEMEFGIIFNPTRASHAS